MPELGLSRLLKAKLRRAFSNPVVPQASKSTGKAGNGETAARNPVNSNDTSVTSLSASAHLFSHDQKDFKPRAYSIVSTIPIDCPSSPDEIAGPATASTDSGKDFALIDRPVPEKSKEEVQADRCTIDHVHTARNWSEENGQKSIVGDHTQSPSRQPSRSQTAPLPRDPPTSKFDFVPPSEQISRISAKTDQGTVRDRASCSPLATSSLSTQNLSNAPSIQLTAPPSATPKRPSIAVRRQTILPPSQQHLISGLLDPGILFQDNSQVNGCANTTVNPQMTLRKVWVKRPGGSATLVSTPEDCLVDDLRDQVVRKYTNSIGRSFDSPDIFIRIAPREGSTLQSTPERVLNPEESLASVIDSYYPEGQTVEEALLIDVPQRRTPKPSPRHAVYYHHAEPGEHGDYFPLMPANANLPPPSGHSSNQSNTVNAHSISILTTGVAPPLPSPGNRSRHPRRPPLTRHTTNSPTMLPSAPGGVKDANISPNGQPVPQASQVPTPPAIPPESSQPKAHTPPTRGVSPRPGRKSKKPGTPSGAFGGLIEGTVPPINVLIVEDNVINQKLLEAFMKRLSVRWKCAANGAEAVKKWREGGFHLVLMDIQLPVMNGLEATKEIRRLERLNGIGVFSKTASGRSSVSSAKATSSLENGDVPQSPDLRDEDVLHDLSLFKSPVVIVALTASSLQSDRHEALAAGCNDFLTKPVAFPWLEQKVTEWGCMQALIDFEGWRKWRGFADAPNPSRMDDGETGPMRNGRGENTRHKGISSVSPRSPRATVVHHKLTQQSSTTGRESNAANSEHIPEEISPGSGNCSGDSSSSLPTAAKKDENAD